MRIYFMKQSAIEHLKTNMKTLYINYYKYNTNEWIYDEFDYDPFSYFMEVPDFELSPLGEKGGITDLENCKRIYSNLKKISESQASDERLWAGLCNGIFYQYVRQRFNYGSLNLKKPESDADLIISRFFFKGNGRYGLYRNSLSKCWWVGKLTYTEVGTNHWVLLDELGSDDLSTKISDIFYSYPFSANLEILKGICDGIQFFRDKNQKILAQVHIRPTLQYMNALGGGILLDALSSEEIKAIFVENIGHIMKGEQGDFFDEQEDNDIEDDFENDENVREIDIDYQEEKDEIEQEKVVIDVSEVLGGPSVVDKGCKIVVKKLSNGLNYNYSIPSDDRELLFIQKVMIGKNVGERFKVKLEEYEIQEITW